MVGRPGQGHLREADGLAGQRHAGTGEDGVDLLEPFLAAERIVGAAEIRRLGELLVEAEVERPQLLGGDDRGLAPGLRCARQRPEPGLGLEAQKDRILRQPFDRFADTAGGVAPAREVGVDFSVRARHELSISGRAFATALSLLSQRL